MSKINFLQIRLHHWNRVEKLSAKMASDLIFGYSNSFTDYLRLIECIVKEVEDRMKENTNYEIAPGIRYPTTTNIRKKIVCCQWYQSQACEETSGLPHMDRNNRTCFIHACELCYRLRQVLIEHPLENCEILEAIDDLNIDNQINTKIIQKKTPT